MDALNAALGKAATWLFRQRTETVVLVLILCVGIYAVNWRLPVILSAVADRVERDRQEQRVANQREHEIVSRSYEADQLRDQARAEQDRALLERLLTAGPDPDESAALSQRKESE